jgi:voltage-gated potassium channel
MDNPGQRTEEHQSDSFKERLWRIIFLSDSGPAQAFDVVLLWLIAASVLVVMLESVKAIEFRHGALLHTLEWIFTVLFTIEYLVRVWVVRRKTRYVFSFFGVVDLLSILPTYLGLFVAGSGYFIVLRILRLFRMFRILKMVHHMSGANILVNALKASRPKIAVFVFGVMSIVCIEGTLMYLIEGGVDGTGFTSIPQSIYWGIVTITTVGYGDIAPTTVFGKMLASLMMLTGFAIIAVPTGIVTVELNRNLREISMDTRVCKGCGHEGHDPKAMYCKICGHEM